MISAVPELEALLAALTSADEQRAEAAVSPLVALGESALLPLLKMLDSADPDHRWWALRALATFDDDRARVALTRALQDPAPAVRQCAALGLRHRPSPQAIPALVAALADRDRLLARLAGDALGALGERALPALSEAARNEDPAVRIEAVRALALAQIKEAIPVLFDALQDASTLVCYWAEEGLTRLGVGMVFFKP